MCETRHIHGLHVLLNCVHVVSCIIRCHGNDRLQLHAKLLQTIHNRLRYVLRCMTFSELSRFKHKVLHLPILHDNMGSHGDKRIIGEGSLLICGQRYGFVLDCNFHCTGGGIIQFNNPIINSSTGRDLIAWIYFMDKFLKTYAVNYTDWPHVFANELLLTF